MRRWIPFWVVPVFLILASITVWLRLSVIRKTYELNQVNQTWTNNKKELERLNIKVAQKKSPRRLEKLARKQLELFPVEAAQVILLEYDE